MKVCDICGNPSTHTSYAYVEQLKMEEIDLCPRCWKMLYDKENEYKHLAYKITVKEITSEEIMEENGLWNCVMKKLKKII